MISEDLEYIFIVFLVFCFFVKLKLVSPSLSQSVYNKTEKNGLLLLLCPTDLQMTTAFAFLAELCL